MILDRNVDVAPVIAASRDTSVIETIFGCPKPVYVPRREEHKQKPIQFELAPSAEQDSA